MIYFPSPFDLDMIWNSLARGKGNSSRSLSEVHPSFSAFLYLVASLLPRDCVDLIGQSLQTSMRHDAQIESGLFEHRDAIECVAS